MSGTVARCAVSQPSVAHPDLHSRSARTWRRGGRQALFGFDVPRSGVSGAGEMLIKSGKGGMDRRVTVPRKVFNS